MFRAESLALRGRDIADRCVIFDLILAGMTEDTNLVVSHNVRPVTLVANGKLLVPAFGHFWNIVVFLRIFLLFLVITLVCRESVSDLTDAVEV